MMSSFFCESGPYNGPPPCVTTTPGGSVPVPVTLNIYNSDTSAATGIGTLVTTVDQTIAMPFRPSAGTDPSGNVVCGPTQWFSVVDNACYNGFSFPVTFNFPSLPTVPDELVWTVAFSTSRNGPIQGCVLGRLRQPTT